MQRTIQVPEVQAANIAPSSRETSKESAHSAPKAAQKKDDLRKLNRHELLEILLEQSRQIDDLKARLAVAEQELAARDITLAESGSLAEASLRLSGIFEAADEAARLYLENVRASAPAAAQSGSHTAGVASHAKPQAPAPAASTNSTNKTHKAANIKPLSKESIWAMQKTQKAQHSHAGV